MSNATAPPPPAPAAPGATDDDLIDLAFKQTLQLAVRHYVDGRSDATAGATRRAEQGEIIADRCYDRGYDDVERARAGRPDLLDLDEAPGATWARLASLAWRARLFEDAPPDATEHAPDWLRQRWEAHHDDPHPRHPQP